MLRKHALTKHPLALGSALKRVIKRKLQQAAVISLSGWRSGATRCWLQSQTGQKLHQTNQPVPLLRI